MSSEIDAIIRLVQTLGMHAVVALMGFMWGFWERRENKVMAQKLMELALAQNEATFKSEAALVALKERLHDR